MLLLLKNKSNYDTSSHLDLQVKILCKGVGF